ncbi:MAG: hypothetical protein JXA07_11485 [Spirochaetes bacterium]|nr:hypothetical protein [Spirochaetota bacterium]
MHARKKGKRRIIPLVLLFSFTCVASLHPQFLEDEEETLPEDIARNISAETPARSKDGKCVIRVSWRLDPRNAGGEYVVAKSTDMIDTADKVRSARVIATVQGAEKNMVEDADCAPGRYYYVVLSKKAILENQMTLLRDSNYTAMPAIVGAPEESLVVLGIRASEIDRFKVRLTWARPDRKGVYYYIYRAQEAITGAGQLEAADKLGTVSDADEFIDEGITRPGDYYYAVTARVLSGKENRSIIPGENATIDGLAIRLSEPETRPAPAQGVELVSIDARTVRDGVLVRWRVRGSGEADRYSLFRSSMPRATSAEVPGSDILAEVDLSRGNYTDPNPLPGRYYYGLFPAGTGGAEKISLVPGVSITRNPVSIREERRIIVGEADDIDRILKRTFFRARYWEAIKELRKFTKNTDNRMVRAKARLFIGRSYVELGRYRTALDYLYVPEVKKYFPKQAAFWQDFSLTRLKNY